MPIVASRGAEIRRLLDDLTDPKRRAAAALRLRALGSRVVPHVADDLGRLDPGARRALLDLLRDVKTEDARALRERLLRAEPATREDQRRDSRDDGAEAKALDSLRNLPPPRGDERPTVSRERGEVHLALARTGSRLARKDLLVSLSTLEAKRTRLYCEAAGLIGDAAFVAPLARIARVRPEAMKALAEIVVREKITIRSKLLRDLDESLRPVVAQALVRP
ncbi:MAG: hypothetical protein JJE39_02580 [Vicinamibacteria bacterium]|nr:hypothetical protein [Vicinamibacteria bacterium]